MGALSETERASRKAALADAHARSEQSERIANIAIPILNIIMYGTVLVGIIGGIKIWFRG